jgi:adenosylcobinamide-phosphate synthase
VNPVEASILILTLAVLTDLLLDEPPLQLHPTVWMGKLAESIETRVRLGSPLLEKFQGVILAALIIGVFATATFLGLKSVTEYFGFVPYLVLSAFLLKSAISIRAMEKFTVPIAEAVEEGDYEEARKLLRNVVRRETAPLTDQQVLSAAVETVAEGTVDGVTGPIFLYSLFGLPGAMAYRVINTLDSTIGYKDRPHLNLGWFSAKLDTAVNYLPARITGVLTVISAKIISLNWANCLEVLARDHRRTESLNAGWSMSAMAGALGVMLEKPGFYTLGEPSRPLEPEDVRRALKIMKLNVLLFSLLVSVPLIFVSRTLIPIV